MTTHSSDFAWRIPWTEKPGGLQSMGSQRVLKRLSMHAQVSTGEESSGFGTDSTEGLGPGIVGRGNPRGHRATRMGTGLS